MRSGNTCLYDCAFKLKIFPLLYGLWDSFSFVSVVALCTYSTYSNKIYVGCCIYVVPSHRNFNHHYPTLGKWKSIKSLLSTCMERRICWYKVFWLYSSLGHLRKSVSLLMEIYPLWARSTTLLTFYVYLRKRRIFMSVYMHPRVLSIAKLVAKILWIQEGSFEESLQVL